MRKHLTMMIVFLLLATGLNIVAVISPGFSDFYVRTFMPIWLNSYGRLTGIFPFSVGEIMIALVMMLIAIAIASGLVAVIFFFVNKNKVNFIIMIVKNSLLTLGYLSSAALLLVTMNCFVYYRCTKLTMMESDTRQYSIEELTTIRNYIVMKTNELSLVVDRDQDDNIIYSEDMAAQAVLSMQKLGSRYERLSGYYPEPKKILASKFLSQQYMKGYYFPFSLEANYNGMMGTIHVPATMCHELAHVKGYLFEEEANMLAFLACIQSDDLTFQYSGYLSVLNYIDNDFYKAVNRDKSKYLEQVRIEERVKKDNTFITEKDWEEIEKKAVIKTETVKKATQKFTDTTLVLNGVSNGYESYSDVVKLLMYYYDEFEPDMMPAETTFVVNAEINE